MSVVRGMVAVASFAWAGATGAQVGSVDANFTPVVNGSVATVASQPDGKILIGGMFTQVNGVARPYLARLNADGSLDGAFNLTAGPAQFVNHIEVAQAKVFVSGGDGIRRFSADGTLDWNYPLYVQTFAVDAQQRVVFGGRFVRVENQYHRNLARLTPAGSLDATFAPAIGCCAGDGVDSILMTGDKILVGGVFQSVNADHAARNIAKVNADGTFDGSFAANAEPLVLALAATVDGKTYRASEQTLARHLPNGTLDTTFAPKTPAGFDERFLAVAVQGEGVIVGGNFTLNDGGTRNHLARFHADGSLDTSFTAQPDGPVRGIAVHTDGSVVIVGDFTHVNGQPHSGVARLVNTATPAAPVLLTGRCAGGGVVISWPAEVVGAILESREINGTAWTQVAVVPITEKGRQCVTNLPVGSGRLYRLVRP